MTKPSTTATQRSLREVIADDSHALTFQTSGLYRAALLKHEPMEHAEAFAWAVFAKDDNVIIWSKNRAQVESASKEYGRPIVPVIALFAAQQAAAPGALPERDLSKPAEQQGLFRKFDVRRTDGSDQPGGKHHGCRYYVLDLTHDQHAPAAMRAYAAACASTHPQLAADIVAEFGAPGTPEAPSHLMQALTNGIPLKEPVSLGKALWAQREARAVLSGGTGPVAAVHLVNIGLTGWVHTKETAEAWADGYNTALKQYRSVLRVLAIPQRAAQLDGGQEGSES